jgi:GTP pyrophosphokinase
VPLKYELQNGDTVEILTSSNQRPNKDWLKFVATSRAKARIRNYIRQEQRDRSLALGKELLDRELRKHQGSLSKLTKEGELDKAATRFKVQTGEELVVAVGYGKLTAHQVVDVLLPPENRNGAPKPESPGPIQKLLDKLTRKSSEGIKIQGIEDMLMKFAKCCNPVPGDPVIGFVTRGRGVTVHTRTCSKTLDLDPERRIEVTWDAKAKAPRPVAIQVICADKPGLLANISQSFTENGVNISQANCKTTQDHRAVNTFQVSVANLDQLKSVMRAIQRINGVFSVQRV